MNEWINEDADGYGSSCLAGLLVWKRSLLRLTNRSIRKATTARINSQVCSARKEMTCPLALKMKLTIEPMRQGRIEPLFLPIVCSPFKSVGQCAITAPIVTSAARTMAFTVNPYFLNFPFTPSRSGSFSRRLSFPSLSAATFCLSSSAFSRALALTSSCSFSLFAISSFSSITA